MEFHDWLLWFLNMHQKVKQTKILITMWALWFARNRRVHEGAYQRVGDIVNFIHSYCVEWASMPPIENGLTASAQVKRASPPIGMVKVNVDVGFHPNQRQASSGIVIRDENGEILGSCYKVTYSVLLIFAAEAEAKAVLIGLRFIKDLGFSVNRGRSGFKICDEND